MESKGIKLDSFIKIESTPIQRAPKLGKLATLLVTKQNDYSVVPEWVQVGNVQDTQKLFGNSTVTSFAKNYFSALNKSKDAPETLYILTYPDSKAVPPSIVGGTTPSLDELKKINGKIKIRMDAVEKEITLNFANKNTHTEIATEFTNAIKTNNNAVNGFKDATVKWSTPYNAFIVQAGSGIKNISFVTPGTGTDISDATGLTEGAGARVVEGYNKVDNLDTLLDNITKRNDSYFFITFDFEFTNYPADLTTVGEWVHDSKNDYCVLYSTTRREVTTQPTDTSRFHNYNGLVIDYLGNYKYQNGKGAGLCSSIDYSKQNGNINIAYSSVPEFLPFSIKDEDTYDIITNINKNRSNCFVTARRVTEGYTWYMQGNVMGQDTSYLNVYIGFFVIKTKLQMYITDWLTTVRFASATDAHSLELVLNNAMRELRSINLISIIDSLDTSERNQINSMRFSNLNSVEKALTTDGFFIEYDSFDSKNQCINVKIVYVANAPVRKVCIKLIPLRGN